MIIAMTRAVPPSITQCELTHLERTPIDVRTAVAEHSWYEATLESLGCSIVRVDSAPGMPDSVFIEDTAVVLDEIAVITRPGAESRRGETEAVATVLEGYRPLHYIRDPATIDGGDVLRVGRALYAGSSSRTNAEGIEQLRTIVETFGYTVQQVPVTGSLHLKSAATAVGEMTVIANRHWLDARQLSGLEIIDVHPDEPEAANVLRIGDKVLVSAAAPRTADRLRQHGFDVVPVAMNELTKAEAGLTCCSLIIEHH